LRVLALYVPGFNPTIPIAQPVWTRDSSILDFSQSHLLYFRLQAKKNTYFTPRNRTNMFLHAIAPSEYANAVTVLQTTVDAYRHPEDDGDLPDNLWIDGIIMMIHQNSKHRVRDVGIPCIHLTHGSTASWDLSEEDDYGYCHIKGYCPCVNCVDHPRDHGSGVSPQGLSCYGDQQGNGSPHFGN
jgi:hypothetical protein